MKTNQDSYPIFESNQVLTSHHLNQVFDYLDEQERLTRANLIGIGIECGLEIRLETVGGDQIVHLSRGCGVGSAGYHLIEDDDVALVSYRKYTLPNEIDYPPFKYIAGGKTLQYPLWELFPAGEPDTDLLGKEKGFLDDKAVLLFLELKSENLRNCSPGNCDDKGNTVTATVRPLLIRRDDLSAIIAQSNHLGIEYTATDLESALLARLNLPDLRLPRYNVPNTSPVSSNDVLAAFLAVFQKSRLAAAAAEALDATYKAFQPLVAQSFPTNPFAGFSTKFGFLDNIPDSTSQVRFLPYYFDFFDDLIQAYDEFRWKGASLMCACTPPEELFPRHLMLGLLYPALVKSPGIYRHDFISSPAIKGCEERKSEVVQLFSRLVEMVNSFTNNPTPPEFTNLEVARKFIPVRITPSKHADAPLSQKAIPYYYLQHGAIPLFRLWNVEKTRHNRANQNLSFRSDEYKPKAPNFVTAAINYDLEPFNFLRIEGHLGKKVENMMNTLLAYKVNNRLPIEIIALRTGEFDPRQAVDLTRETCRFEDLEAMYDAFRDEFISSLGKTLASLYAKKVSKDVILTEGFKPTLIHSLNPDIQVESSTFGAMFEMLVANQNKAKSARTAKMASLSGTTEAARTFDTKKISWINIRDAFVGESVVIQATVSYAEVLLDICNYLKDRALSAFDLNEFHDLFLRLETLNNQFKNQDTSKNNEWNDLFNLLEAVRYASQMEAFRSIGEEYRKRLLETKKKLFLANFLQKHPGIQHKAGVTMGGTFIVVYHDDPTPIRIRPTLAAGIDSLKSSFTKIGFASESSDAISKAFERLQSKSETLKVDPDIELIISEVSKQVAQPDFNSIKGFHVKTADKIIAETVNEFADGTVIADFYLPYICCSDCSPIQYMIPRDPLNFSVTVGCTDAKTGARIHITPWGGTAPYKVKIGSNDFIDLKDEFLLPPEKYTLILRDSEGTLSDAQQIEVAEPLLIGEPLFDCQENNTYNVTLEISGGMPPYSSNIGKINDKGIFTDEALPCDTDSEVIITDSRKCKVSKVLNHSCIPPLTFTTSIDCTDEKGNALVTIHPAGGKAPYEFKLEVKVLTNVSKYVPLTDPIPLPAGKHILRVRDSLGTETLPQEIDIPEALKLEIAEFICNKDAKSYQVRIIVTGGTQPYQSVDGEMISGTENEFLTKSFASGAGGKFSVTDSNDCHRGLEFTHVCEQPCNLPCDGQSRKCAYRLWLQPAAEGSVYQAYEQMEDLKFRFNGKDIALPLANTLLQITVDGLNKEFANAMAKTIGRLNEVIQEALGKELGTEAKDFIALTYEPSESDPFGVLWVEHLVCKSFNLEFGFTYTKSGQSFKLGWRYTTENDTSANPVNGAYATNMETNAQSFIPAFDCRERNLCKGSDYIKLCSNPNLKVDFSIKKIDANKLYLVSSPNTNIACCVWDILNTAANEPFYTGDKSEFTVLKPSGRIRLTVIDSKGCFATAENLIPQ